MQAPAGYSASVQFHSSTTVLPEAEYPADRCIHQLFEARAARTPDAVAVVHEADALTYRELNERANRLAHLLAAHGVERGVTVGVCLEWRLELVVALLATLKAGGVYVPLDPSLPSDRLAYMAEDAGLRAVVTSAGLADRMPPGAAVRVDVDAEEVSPAPAGAPRSRVSPADLAYIAADAGVRAVVTRAALADRVPAGIAVRVDVDAEEVSAAPGGTRSASAEEVTTARRPASSAMYPRRAEGSDGSSGT